MSVDGKHIINMIYHAAIESLLTVGYSQLSKKILKYSTPRVDFSPADVGMLTVNIGLAMATRDMLIKQGILPADIIK